MNNELRNPFFGFVLLLIISLVFFSNIENDVNFQKISNITDEWIKNITVRKNPNKVANTFCNNAKLIDLVSKIIRRGVDIEEYFNFFVNLQNIKVLERNYNIQKITNNVYVNTAFLKWYWDGLVKPVIIRMTFVFKNNCILQLTADELPEFNINL